MKRLPGKRLEIFEVHTKLRPIEVEIRIEKNGTVYAMWAGERFESKSVEELRGIMRTHVRAHEDATFTFKPFIEYRLIGDGDRPKYAKHERREVAYAGLEYRVIELSEETVGEKKARLCRPAKVQLDLEGALPFSFVETRRYFPATGVRVVPYTFERLRALEEIAATIQRLRKRLHEFLDVPEDVIEDSLDWLIHNRLFPNLLTPGSEA
jgi:hypothetical protein